MFKARDVALKHDCFKLLHYILLVLLCSLVFMMVFVLQSYPENLSVLQRKVVIILRLNCTNIYFIDDAFLKHLYEY